MPTEPPDVQTCADHLLSAEWQNMRPSFAHIRWRVFETLPELCELCLTRLSTNPCGNIGQSHFNEVLRHGSAQSIRGILCGTRLGCKGLGLESGGLS